MPRIDKTEINMYDLLICLTNAGDLISHEVANHHQQVAYLAFKIGEQLGLPSEQKKDLMLAGLLHDMGAFSLDERLDLIENEPQSSNDHAFRGARLIEGFSPLSGASNIIDFRNPSTAIHSAGVAKTAEKLAELAGFSENECKMMLVAGYLHDLGKLAVSKNILDKPGSLDIRERNVIRSHSFYTYRLLQSIKGFETINEWASFHHEKLNGNGYPFHMHSDSIPLGSRIMAVSDIFTAITEDRPYRKGMTLEEAVSTLNFMVKDNSICPYVVSILTQNLNIIDEIRKDAQKKSKVMYNYIMESI